MDEQKEATRPSFTVIGTFKPPGSDHKPVKFNKNVYVDAETLKKMMRDLTVTKTNPNRIIKMDGIAPKGDCSAIRITKPADEIGCIPCRD